MQNQFDKLFLQTAEARRQHGVSERDGTIHEVLRKNGEQKVRVNIGMRPDGSPLLSPWLKVEDHHGSARTQRKWHKGMNVKVSTVGADMSKATVSPGGENKDHPEPDHADDYNETEQYGKHRSRKGPDFEERYLVGDSEANTNLGDDITIGGATGIGSATKEKDPDKVSTVLSRWGAKPSDQQDKNQPWEGPPPDGGTAKKQQLDWAGSPGDTPAQTGDGVVTQFGKHAKTEHTDGNVLQKVQSSDGQAMPIPDAPTSAGGAIQTVISHLKDGVLTHMVQNTALGQIVSAIHKNGSVTHTIQDNKGNVSTFVQQAEQIIHQTKGPNGFSVITQGAGQIMHQVGNSVLQILESEININSSAVKVNGQSMQGFSNPPVTPDAINGNDPAIIGRLLPIEAGLAVQTFVVRVVQISAHFVVH